MSGSTLECTQTSDCFHVNATETTQYCIFVGCMYFGHVCTHCIL